MRGLGERRKISGRLGERYYPSAARRDPQMKSEIARRLPSSGVFLDAGSGAYIGLARLYASSARLSVGMDRENLRPDMLEKGARGVVGDLAALPFAARSVDVVALRSVLEHLSDPARVFRELAAVLKPGGWIVALAPSSLYYASVIGRLLPDAAGRRVLRFVFGSTVYDNYPTYYRANSPRALARLALQAGLDLVESIACPHPPDYLKFSPLLFRLGVAYDRAAGALSFTRRLQASFLYLIRKPS